MAVIAEAAKSDEASAIVSCSFNSIAALITITVIVIIVVQS